MKLSSAMDTTTPDQTPVARHPRKWLWVVVPVVILIIVVAVTFYILVRSNIASIGGNDNSEGPVIRVETADDPYKGPVDSKIVIVEFSDFQCPYCYEAFPVVGQITSTYSDQVKFIYRDFPISTSHPDAQRAAEAGECAHEQGRFWEMHDKMFINHDDLSATALARYGVEIGLDSARFDDCMSSNKYTTEVRQDFADGYFAGVDGTPTFFVNGRKFEGSPTLENFKSIIDQLIAIYNGQGTGS